jgi:hypothetical protein
MTTLGYGDITPITAWGGFLVIAQTLIGLFMVVLVLTFFVSLLRNEPKRNRKNKESTS